MSRRTQAAAARQDISERLRIEGLEAAYRRAIKLLNDDDVPATAQAQMVRVVFQAGALLESALEDENPKELYEMTAEELAFEIQESERRLAALRSETFDDPNVMD